MCHSSRIVFFSAANLFGTPCVILYIYLQWVSRCCSHFKFTQHFCFEILSNNLEWLLFISSLECLRSTYYLVLILHMGCIYSSVLKVELSILGAISEAYDLANSSIAYNFECPFLFIYTSLYIIGFGGIGRRQCACCPWWRSIWSNSTASLHPPQAIHITIWRLHLFVCNT